MSAPDFTLIATTPRGLSDLVARELADLGGQSIRERGTGVLFRGSLEVAYRACLWSRVASRVLLQLAECKAESADEFYAAVRAMDWHEHVDPARTIACEFSGTHPGITNSHYGALRLKDGICDALRAATGQRPDVELRAPAVRLHAHANGTQISVSLDLAGEGLHRRGYRLEAGEAPLRENVAAGMLLRAGWLQMAAQGAEFLDPMCGSGTLVIEAALIAAERAPALTRSYFGFLGWRGHDAALWQRLRQEAQERARHEILATVRGSDRDARVLESAQANAQRAGILQLAGPSGPPTFAVLDVQQARALTQARGLVCTNPPYGVRLGDADDAQMAYQTLGRTLRQHFKGWEAAILSGIESGPRALQLRSYRTHAIWNGALECRLLRIDLSDPGTDATEPIDEAAQAELARSPGALMFANRVGKNIKRLMRVAARQQISCFRLYDADMPEYAFAIDRYVLAESGETHLYVQEYAAPASIAPEAARKRRREALAALPAATQVPRERIHLRLRRRQAGSAQYTKLGASARLHVVAENNLKVLINFDDYLDTGLFLDHRLTRERLRAAAADTRFLNLFCYTATATLYAASGGARSSVSVDLSNTYLDWAAQNLRLNGLDTSRHTLVRADCRDWLRAASLERRQFDLIFLDPPTFSNSKRMQGVLDVQRDHAALIEACLAVLAPTGLLVFSTNAQRFQLDTALQQRAAITDVSAATIPFDFERNGRIHRCFEIRHL